MKSYKQQNKTKHIKTNQSRKTHFAQYYGRNFTVGLTFVFRKSKHRGMSETFGHKMAGNCFRKFG